MLEKIKENKEKIFLYILFFSYAISSLIITILHESWCDEAQAWLIARDLDVIGIIRQMKYEGHSCLWHMILMPFAKLGFPFATAKYISWGFCTVAAWMILMKAPFSKLLKALFLFNPAMIYLIPAITRCYCLIPFLVSILSILYKEKEEHPYKYAVALAFLVNVHVVMIPMAALLVLTFWGEKLILKRKELEKEEKIRLWLSLGFVALGALIMFLQIYSALFGCTILDSTNKMNNILNLEYIKYNLNLTLVQIGNYLYHNEKWGLYGMIVVCMLLVLATVLHPRQGFIFWLELIFLVFVQTFVWFVNKQRAVIPVFLLLFWCWNARQERENGKLFGKIPETVFIDLACAVFLIVTMYNYVMIRDDIVGKYSTSKEVASFIEEKIPKGSVFICPNNEKVTSIIAYTKKGDYQFYAPNSKKYYTYISWDRQWQNLSSMKDIENAIDDLKNEGHENIYVIIGKYITYADMDIKVEKFPKIYVADDSFHTYYAEYEDYIVYKVNF